MKEIEILFEDDNLLVLNKPAGLNVHSDGKVEEKTLSDWLLEKYPEIKDIGEPWKMSDSDKVILRPGIVHRLDKETSGVMVVAKNQNTYLFLKKQFQEREVFKSYRSFVYGGFKETSGVINKPIGRSPTDFRQRSAMPNARGALREAETEYKVIFSGREYSFVEAVPKTGRTHQIRVHLKAINHPVVCDKLYAPKRDCLLGFQRLALHAFNLKFKSPDNKELDIEAPYPEDFKIALKEAGIEG